MEFTDGVMHLRSIAEREIAVSEILRDVKRLAVVLGELHRDPLLVRSRLRPQIHDDVEDRTSHAPHDLDLLTRLPLPVQAAKRAPLVVVRDVGLRDACLEAVRRELALAERPREKTARVLQLVEIDFERAFELGLDEL